ncbi:RIP homotypic interaction motif-containing protein [Actinophytocola sediminis]
MSELELVVTALTAGAAAGLTATASGAIQDAYAGLRAAVRKRLAAHGEDAAEVLDAEDQATLGEALAASGADRDEDVLAAARALMAQLEAAGGPTVIVADVREAKGVQLGDHNTQTNTFN